MSYGRGTYYRFVKASFKGSYVYKTEIEGEEKIIKHGEQTKYDYIERLCKYWNTEDIAFKKWFIKQLADHINVKLLPNFDKRIDMWNNEEYNFEKQGLEVIDYTGLQ